MDGLAFGLTLASAFLHALWNASLKRSANGSACLMAAGALQGLVALPVLAARNAWAGVAAAWPFILLSAAIYVAYRLLLAKAFQTGSLSQAYAIARSSPILIALGGWLILGETISPGVWLAITVMLAGVVLLHLRELAALWGPAAGGGGAWTGSFWAALTAFSVTGYTLSDKSAVTRMDATAFYFVATALSMAFYLVHQALSTAGRERLRAIRASWAQERGRVLFISLLEPASYILNLSAFTMAPVGQVSAVRQTSVVIAACIGIFFFREPAGFSRIAGAMLVAAGAVGIKLLG